MAFKNNFMRVVTSAVFAVTAVSTAVQFSYFSEADEVSAELTSLTAEEITSQMTIGWNLGNSLDATASSGTPSTASPKKFATAWGNPEPTEELIETVNNAGFNTIRIPTTWYQHLSYNASTDEYEIEPTWMEYVKQTVDWAYERDMFIILNVHHEDFVNQAQFTDETLKDASKKLGDIWSQVAETFSDYDQHLIFEGMNEPRQTGNSAVSEWGNGSEDGGYTWNYINTLEEVFIDTVRSDGTGYNNERLLMLPSYCATTDTQALNALTIPENAGNVAISTHAYSPYFFTMATDEYANHEFPGKSGWGEDYEYALDNLFNGLKSVSESKGVPIVMGEFSASDFENTDSRVNWAKAYLSRAKEAGIPCVLWDNNVSANGTGEAHGYIYRATNTIYPNSADVLKAMMETVGVTDYVLPEYKEYERPSFSWDTVKVGSDWKEIYRNESGEKLGEWKNIEVKNWKDYANENYMFAFVYDSEDKAEIVFMNSAGGENWNRVSANDDKSGNFVAYFTYDDIVSSITGGGTLEDMDCLFLSATMKELTAYGLYAVPVSESGEVTETTETTETTPSEKEALLGDVNCDENINCFDFVAMKNYLLNGENPDGQAFINSDMDENGVIDVRDAVLLKKIIVA